MNLETKRNIMMNAIQSGSLTNLLPVNLTWRAGYFANSDGSITQSSSAKEMYESEYIEVDITKTYYVCLDYGTSHSAWIGIAQYNDDLSFYSRPVPINANITKDFNSIKFQKSKIRISLRTYGNVKIGLYDKDEVLDLMQQMNEVEWE